MKSLRRILCATLAWACLPVISARAETAAIGRSAPDFTLTDIHGAHHALSDYKGRIVVLEWTNPLCPFVGKHYRSGNMQRLQKTFTGEGVVWLTINSAAPGLQGDYSDAQAAAWLQREGAAPTAYLRDPTGQVGHLYDARATPGMYVINAAGVLVYAGAIDSIRSTRIADIAKAENYVTAAITAVKTGRPVATPATEQYGCTVKY